MATVTVPSDFGAQENSLSLFSLFPYLPLSDGTGAMILYVLKKDFELVLQGVEAIEWF